MEYFLSAPHWLDAMTPPLERHLQKLADAIETLLPNESASQVRSGSQAADHTDQRSTIANTFDSSQRVALPSDLQPKSIPEVLRAGSGIQPNLAGALCYAAGWITGIIFLLLEKDNKFIRFQAVQSIVTFGAITFIWIFLPYVGFLGTILSWMLGIIALILWFVLMYKAYRNEIYKLPVAGDIAEKQSRFKPEPR